MFSCCPSVRLCVRPSRRACVRPCDIYGTHWWIVMSMVHIDGFSPYFCQYRILDTKLNWLGFGVKSSKAVVPAAAWANVLKCHLAACLHHNVCVRRSMFTKLFPAAHLLKQTWTCLFWDKKLKVKVTGSSVLKYNFGSLLSWYFLSRTRSCLLVRPPGTVVPGGLMFCWGFFCGTLRRYISEMAEAIALKLSHMIGSVCT